jgi:hypothetical protein
MRDVRSRIPAAVDLGDLVASYVRILGDLVENDGHDRLRPISTALRREISYLRAGLIEETAAEPVAAEVR